MAEELAIVRDIALLACDPRYKTFCFTPYQVKNITSERQKLTQYIKETWSENFLNYSILLREQISDLNSTRAVALDLNSYFMGQIWNNIKKLFDLLDSNLYHSSRY